MPKTTTGSAKKKDTEVSKVAPPPVTPFTPPLPSPNSNLAPLKISTPEELFMSDLKDMYWSELHLVKALPRMADAAGTEELKAALEDHFDVTRTQVDRLEQVFDLLEVPNHAKKCDALEGLVISGEHIIENTMAQTPARETGLISAGLKVENFEITCYTSLIQLANTLGQAEVAKLLTLNLEEEKEASALLTSLSADSGK